MALPEPHDDTAVSPVPLTRRELREQERLQSTESEVLVEAESDIVSSDDLVVEADAVPAVPVSTVPVSVDADVVAAMKSSSVLARSSQALRSIPRPAPRPRSVKPERAARKPKFSVRAVATIFVVPGLFLTVALPAYASAPNVVGTTAAHEQNLADAQVVDVASFANQISVARDGYSATTSEELAAAKAEAARVAAAEERAASSGGGYSVVGQQAPGDDYPWWDQATDDQGGGLSPLRYYYRECVDFVAWRMNRDAGSYGAPFRWDWSNMASGSAYKWPSEWERHGWMTSTTPVVGAVAAFPGGNHVAYVQSVNGDGTVSLEEYNWGNDHAYHTRTIPASEVPIYLYPPA